MVAFTSFNGFVYANWQFAFLFQEYEHKVENMEDWITNDVINDTKGTVNVENHNKDFAKQKKFPTDIISGILEGYESCDSDVEINTKSKAFWTASGGFGD